LDDFKNKNLWSFNPLPTMSKMYHAITNPIAYAGQTALIWVFGNKDVIKNPYQSLSP
jgi:hypothetical protein